MALKDYLEKDLQDVIFNCGEFADEHKWNDMTIKAVIDDDSLMKDYQTVYQMLPSGSHRVLVAASYFAKPPKTGATVWFDGVIYTIFEVTDQQGMYVIHLGRGKL